MTPTPNSFAFITGSARGIGKEIALQLAQDGFDIALNDLDNSILELRSIAEEIEAKGRRVLILPGDVTTEEVVDGLVAKAVEELGELYIMVANAGIGTPLKAVVDLSVSEWERYLSVNLTHVFLCYRAAARQMLKQDRPGRIIGASSGYGKRGGAHAAAYSATKFAVRGLTQSLATELAKTGITVNAYAPGWIDTPLVDGVFDYHLQDVPETDRQAKKELLRTTMLNANPMGRIGNPKDVSALVSYIVSEKADFMTGQSISVDGGYYYD